MKTANNIPNIPDAVSSEKASVPLAAITPMPAGDVARVVTEYNQISDRIKALEETRKVLGDYITEQGTRYVMRHNCAHADEPREQIASVRFVDPEVPDQVQLQEPQGEAEAVLFSLQNAYLKLNRTADKALGEMSRRDGKKANPDDYLYWKIVAEFDTEVFYVDGEFSQSRYDAFMRAVAAIARKYKVECPLSCGKLRTVKPTFHTRRWVDFSTAQNVVLQAVVPAKTSLKSQRPEPDPAAVSTARKPQRSAPVEVSS